MCLGPSLNKNSPMLLCAKRFGCMTFHFLSVQPVMKAVARGSALSAFPSVSQDRFSVKMRSVSDCVSPACPLVRLRSILAAVCVQRQDYHFFSGVFNSRLISPREHEPTKANCYLKLFLLLISSRMFCFSSSHMETRMSTCRIMGLCCHRKLLSCVFSISQVKKKNRDVRRH